MLTTYDLDEYVFEALRAGASGFLLKDSPPNSLISGIATVARGDALLAPSVTRRLITEFARRPPEGPRRTLPDLTPEKPRSSSRLPGACRTAKSRASSSSAKPPSRPMSATS